MKENAIVIPPKPNFKGLKEGTEEFKARSREVRRWRLLYEPGFKENTARYRTTYYDINQDKIKLKNNEPANVARRNEQQKIRRQKNYSKNREYHKAYFKKCYYNDPVFRLDHVLRVQLRDCVKEGFIKEQSFLSNIGCTVFKLKQHIETQFTSGITWDNYGTTWHIDHILPLAVAKQFELKLCSVWHYTNLQPLRAEINISKHHKLCKAHLTKLLAQPDTPDELVEIALALLSY